MRLYDYTQKLIIIILDYFMLLFKFTHIEWGMDLEREREREPYL